MSRNIHLTNQNTKLPLTNPNYWSYNNDNWTYPGYNSSPKFAYSNNPTMDYWQYLYSQLANKQNPALLRRGGELSLGIIADLPDGSAIADPNIILPGAPCDQYNYNLYVYN